MISPSPQILQTAGWTVDHPGYDGARSGVNIPTAKSDKWQTNLGTNCTLKRTTTLGSPIYMKQSDVS